jgi:hypothetical protein
MRNSLLQKQATTETKVTDTPAFKARFAVTAAEAFDMGQINAIVAEMMPILKPGLPVPEIKISNGQGNTLGECLWKYGNIKGVDFCGDNTTITLQKRICGDERTLRRIIAHELAHHEDSLVNDAKDFKEKGYEGFIAYRKMLRPDSHGAKWLAIAARFNAKYGKNFVTRTSDQDMVVDDTNLKPCYMLIEKYYDGSLMWQVANRLSPKAKKYLSELASYPYLGALGKDRYEHKLFMSSDPLLIKKGAPLIQYNGWATVRNEGAKERLEELWNNGVDILPQFATQPKTADLRQEIVGITPKSSGQYVWVYHPEVGLYIRKGGYASHDRIFGDLLNTHYDETPYDEWDRGYAELDPAQHTMYIMPTDAKGCYDWDIEKAFKKRFSRWKIVKLDEYERNFKRPLLPLILEGIREFVYRELRAANNVKNRSAAVNTLRAYIEEALEYVYASANTKSKGSTVLISGSFETFQVTLPKALSPETKVRDFIITPGKGKYAADISRVHEKSDPFWEPENAAKLSDPFWERVKADFLSGIVYHGTTVEIAEIILKTGFRGLDWDAILDDVLAKYRKTREDIPMKTRKSLEGTRQSYTEEHTLVSTSPAGEVACRFAGTGGEVPRQIEAYILGKYSTRDVPKSRLKGEPAIIKCRIRDFETTQYYRAVKQWLGGLELLIEEGSVKGEFTPREAAEGLWTSYSNFTCKPDQLEVLGVLTGAQVAELKEHPLGLTEQFNLPLTAAFNDRYPKTASPEWVFSYMNNLHKSGWSGKELDDPEIGMLWLNQADHYELQEVPLHSLSWGMDSASDPVTKDYAESETEFPPVVVAADHWVIDGYHRCTAARQRGDEFIWAYMAVGSKKTAALNPPADLVYHNTRSTNLEAIKREGLEAGSFSNKPIDFGGDVWLAVSKADLPKLDEYQYGDATAYDPRYEYMQYEKDENGFCIGEITKARHVIPADKIYVVTKRGRVVSKLSDIKTASVSDQTNWERMMESEEYKWLPAAYLRELNDPWVEYVPISQLLPLREYHWNEINNRNGTDKFADLVEDIKRHGVRSPITIRYFKDEGTALIIEGNHRVAAALRAGLTEVPARVTIASYSRDTYGSDISAHEGGEVRGLLDPEERIFSDYIKPSAIGLTGTVRKTAAVALDPLIAERDAKFEELAQAQRGAPEQAMLRCQMHPLGAGVGPHTLEHVGDITNRMAQHFSAFKGQYGIVKDKVEKTLRWLTNGYGFAREMSENMLNNYEARREQIKGKTYEELKADFFSKWDAYAEAHAALRVFNYPQRLARDAAVALGKRDFARAITNLRLLMNLLDKGEDAYEAAAGEYKSKGEKVAATKTYHFQPLPFEEFLKEQQFVDKAYWDEEELEHKEYEYDENVQHFGTLQFPVTVWRALELPEGTPINFDKMGVHWTWVENSADAYFGGSSMWAPSGAKKGELVIIKAQVLHPDDVDWQGTLRANFIDPQENELRVVSGAQLKLIGVSRGDDFSYKPVPGQMTVTASRSVNPNDPKVLAKLESIFKELREAEGEGQCYTMAEILNNKFGWEETAGFYLNPGEGHNGHGDHAWNVTKEGTIVDGTHDQFGPPNIAVITKGDPEYAKYHAYCGNKKCPYCGCEQCNPGFAKEGSHKTPALSDTTFPNMDKTDGEGTNAYADLPDEVEDTQNIPCIETMLGEKPKNPLLQPSLKRAYDEDGEPDYISGECWQYAIALVELTGYVPYVISSSDSGPIHAAVMTPAKRFLDAGGVFTLQQLGKRYGLKKPFATPTTVEGLAAIAGAEDDEVEETKKVAIEQLKKLDIPAKRAGAGDRNKYIPRTDVEDPALHREPLFEDENDLSS